jgi:predicted  nucleic acid-binding Zn-ribbon protein
MKMKNYFILLLAALPLFFGCENKKQTERIMNLQSDSLRLARMVDDKDATINTLFQTLNEIEENLASIRSKESLIADQTTDTQEMKAEVKERIHQNISEINELMDKNKQLINRLNAQVRSSNLKIAELNKAIERMQETIKSKENEIADLKTNIANLNVQVETLNTQVADLEEENKEKDKMIDEKIGEINKAWYVVGDRRDLRDRGIINREGGFIFIGKVTTPAVDLVKKDFAEIDLREVNEIEINANRAEVITVHPVGSYELVGERPIEKLVITNAGEFWKASRYLVISTR